MPSGFRAYGSDTPTLRFTAGSRQRWHSVCRKISKLREHRPTGTDLAFSFPAGVELCIDCLAEVRSRQTPRNLFGVDRFSRCVALRPGPDLAAEFPGLEALQFDATRLRIGPTEDAGAMFIEERLAAYRRTYVLETLKDEPRLRAYRDFFWRVGVDPTKVRPAAEALLRRVIQGKPFPRINALVDAYNLASAETRIALAAFDKAKLNGDLRMRRSRLGETFLGIGMQAPVALTGVEVVCEDADRLLAIYPYRDAEASKVTPATRDVRFLVCGVPGISHEALREAAAVAANTVMRFCGGTADGPW